MIVLVYRLNAYEERSSTLNPKNSNFCDSNSDPSVNPSMRKIFIQLQFAFIFFKLLYRQCWGRRTPVHVTWMSHRWRTKKENKRKQQTPFWSSYRPYKFIQFDSNQIALKRYLKLKTNPESYCIFFWRELTVRRHRPPYGAEPYI